MAIDILEAGYLGRDSQPRRTCLFLVPHQTVGPPGWVPSLVLGTAALQAGRDRGRPRLARPAVSSRCSARHRLRMSTGGGFGGGRVRVEVGRRRGGGGWRWERATVGGAD